MEKRQALVQIKDLRQYFDIGSGKTVHSLNGINLDIYAGEALGIVGESGCENSLWEKKSSRSTSPLMERSFTMENGWQELITGNTG